MASMLVRRPLPALIALFALLLLTALVWWRVLHRDDDNAGAHPSCPSPTPTPSGHTLPAPAGVTVQVLNGTFKLKPARSGIAGKVQKKLIKDRFQLPDEAADDKTAKVRTVAEIRFGPKGRPGATLLNYYFDQKAKLVPTPEEKSATVTVSLGRRYKTLASRAEVKHALASDHITLIAPTKHTPTHAASCVPSTPATTSATTSAP